MARFSIDPDELAKALDQCHESESAKVQDNPKGLVAQRLVGPALKTIIPALLGEIERGTDPEDIAYAIKLLLANIIANFANNFEADVEEDPGVAAELALNDLLAGARLMAINILNGPSSAQVSIKPAGTA